MNIGSSRSLVVQAAIVVIVLALVVWYMAASEGSIAVLARSFLRGLVRAFF